MFAKFGMALGLVILSNNFAFAEVPPPTAGKVHQVFDIIREGSKIGTTVFDIERKGDITSVKVATNIVVTVMFIEAYRYVHNATETWKGTQLTAFKSQTDDNGTKHSVSVTGAAAAPAAAASAAPEKLILDANGKKSDASKMLVPASLWNKDFSKQAEFFDPKDGQKLAVQVKDLGDETITVHGAPRKVRHIKLAGDLERDLWFEGDTLIRMKLIGSDKSIVISELQ